MMGSGALSYLVGIELRQRARSIALLALIVAIVVGTVLTSVAAARRTATSFDRYLSVVDPVDVIVFGDGLPEDAADLEGLPVVEAATSFEVFLALPTDGGNNFFPMLVSRDGLVPSKYQHPPVAAGRMPDPSAADEVALGERVARRLGVTLGDALPMVSYTPAQYEADPDAVFDTPPGGPSFDLRVVGILREPGDIAAREQDLAFTYLTPAFATERGGEVAVLARGALVVLASGASASDLSAELAPFGAVEVDATTGAAALRDAIDPTLGSLSSGLYLVALVAGVTGAVALLQACARASSASSADHDALIALGVGRTILLVRLAAPGTLAAVFGTLLGLGLTVLASPIHPFGLARRAEPHPGVDVDGSVVLFGGAVALAAVLAAVALTAVLAIRRHDAEPSRTSRARTSLAARAAEAGAPVPVVSGLRLALDAGRGARATPVRTATGAAAGGAVGVLAAVVFGASLHHTVTTPAVYGWGWDALLTGDPDERALVEDPELSAVAEVIFDLETVVEGTPVRALAVQDLKGRSTLVVAKGRQPQGEGEVAIAAATLDDLDRQIGDTVTVNAGGANRAMEVIGVVVMPVTDDGGSSSRGLAMTRTAANAAGFGGSCEGNLACFRNYALTAADGADPASLGADHADPDAGIAVDRPRPPSDVERLTAVQELPRVLASFLALIAIVAVTHAAATTVRRRRHDLAVLRVLGFTARQLRTTVAVQVAVLVALGTAVGSLVGVIVGRLTWGRVAQEVSLPVVVDVPVVAVVGVPIATLVLAHAAATFARRAAAQLRAADVLRTE